MTTSKTPLRVLQAQADSIARHIAAFGRGELPSDNPVYDKLRDALKKDSVKLGLVMDDKLITIDIPWTTIRTSGEVALSAYILKLMRGEREN